MSFSDITHVTDDSDLEIRNAAIQWDTTPPKIPVLGSDEINNTPYEARDDEASLYNRFISNQVAEDYNNIFAKSFRWTASLFGWASQLRMTDDDLIQLILKDYPRRPDLIVEVMDFSPGKFTRTTCRLEEMSVCKEPIYCSTAYKADIY